MKDFKKLLHTLLYPHSILILLLTLLSAAGLCWIFLNELDETAPAYAVYMLSFYTLCVLSAAAPRVFRYCRAAVYRNTHAARYLTERELRTRISLYGGTLINLAYAVFKFITGICFRSVWFGAAAVYYLVLCLIRFVLIRGDRNNGQIDGKEQRLLHDWRSYHYCGWLLLILNAAISGMVVQMIWQNRSYSYPGFIIYASAAYTFYRLTMAIIRTVQTRRGTNPVFAAAKAMDLCAALLVIFALQTAMFSSFGMEMDAKTRGLMNLLTGSAVCLAVLCIAIYMLIHSAKILRAKSSEMK